MSNRSRFFSSSNPFVSEERYARTAEESRTLDGGMIATSGETMTVSGAVNKSFILTGILLTTAFGGFVMAGSNPSLAMPFLIIGLIGGIISMLVAMFKPTTAPITTSLYAGFEGLFVGVISLVYAARFGDKVAGLNYGLIFNAVMLTALCLVAMLGAYRTGLIKPTEKFKSILFTATAAIGLLYLTNMVLGLFGVGVPYIHESGPIGIGLSLIIVGVAALNLIIDFESFEKGEEYQAPKYMEWISAMGLMVTLVWLYLEILRLLSKFQSRD